MKKIFWVGLFSISVFAANPSPTSLNQFKETENSSRTSINIGSVVVAGKGGMTVGMDLMTQVSPDFPLFLGADLSVYFMSLKDPNNASAVAFQVTPSALYIIHMENKRIQPYVGVSVGPNVFISRYTNSSKTDIFFEMLFRPGLQMNMAEGFSIGIESKIGILDVNAIFLPQIAFTFLL